MDKDIMLDPLQNVCGNCGCEPFYCECCDECGAGPGDPCCQDEPAESAQVLSIFSRGITTLGFVYLAAHVVAALLEHGGLP